MVFNRYLIRLLMAFVSVLSISAGAAGAKESSPAELLSQQFAAMESMEAKFVQKIYDEKQHLLQKASGRVVVKRPRQFYWKTEDPYQHLVVANGKTLWVYDIDLEQITRQPFTDDLDRAPALILSGESAGLAAQYDISVKESYAFGLQSLVFTLKPRSEDNVFRELSLGFVSGKIASMKMKDSFQQLTDIAFSHVSYNPTVDPGQFQFTPPAGIDVIENEP